ncbi:MAG: SIS domain-containing protein [Clostridia bacterium]|nr:SIS domain-containing protein [Clostridia bacterium]
MKELFKRYPKLISCRAEIEAALALLSECFRTDGKLLLCGNGGSADDCEHIVGELMKNFLKRRPPSADFCARLGTLGEDAKSLASCLQGALPAISLPNQSALISAFSNDAMADAVYAQMVYGYGKPGDMLWCISTSGNAKNAVLAAKGARAMGLRVLSLTGERESDLSRISDVTIRVPERETFKVQELHLPVYHALCAALENVFFDA